MPPDFLERIEIIEECYEFMLAYAAQGLPGDEGCRVGGQLRALLTQSVEALTGIAGSCGFLENEKGLAFLAVLDRDARDSAAAIQLVLGQKSINSQLVDNLNASVHVRALLTDLFLLGECVRESTPQ
jgi:hypothetical protein